MAFALAAAQGYLFLRTTTTGIRRSNPALERLADLYHFTVHYQKGVRLDTFRFSTAFTKEETPEQMIRNILFITDCTYRITGNTVDIFRK